MPERRRITVVNDNPEFLGLMQDVLQDASYPATLIDGDRENARELIEASDPEILVIDLRLGTDSLKGMEILRWLRDHPTYRHIPVIVCTADSWAVESMAEELNRMPNVTVLLKPFSVEALHAALGTAGVG
jgi:CheY-like chemotaxis protein